eukprot:scaffold50855_cov28-Tisochrysis_lutea.AAC.1
MAHRSASGAETPLKSGPSRSSASATERAIETGTSGPTTRGARSRVRVRLYTEAEAGSEPRKTRKPAGATAPSAPPIRE